jgi:hypothetical protein
LFANTKKSGLICGKYLLIVRKVAIKFVEINNYWLKSFYM